jgi:inosine-uridine nucleoside N-ribohydrolase
MTATNLRMILDCDPGHDDALAILLASRFAELVAVTTVGGNVGLDRTTTNALQVLDLIGRPDVPVHAGSSQPLHGDLKTATNIHGESGLAGPELPPPSRPPTGTDAVRFLIDAISAEHAAGSNDGRGVWLVVTGPMTNVARAFTVDPTLPSKIAGVSFMGGSTHVGNWTAVAEFNIWGDAEAADIVVRSGVPLIMAGLNITHTFQAIPERVSALAAVGTRTATLFAALLAEFSDRYRARQSDVDGAPMHDPLAVLALTHPELFETYNARLDIETVGAHTKGMTIVDQRSFRDMPRPNCRVLQTVDAGAAFALIIDAAAAS